MIRETSLRAFETVPPTERQASVLEAIGSLGECTDQEIATKLSWPINCVTGRRGELVKAKQIERCGRKINSNGNPAYVWRLTLTKSQPSFQYDKEGQTTLFP